MSELTKMHGVATARMAAVLLVASLVAVAGAGVGMTPAWANGAISPREMKVQVQADLEALTPTGDPDADLLIDRAAKFVGFSLEPSWYVTDDLLSDADGRRVFAREQRAVEEILSLSTSGDPFSADIQSAIDRLVDADRRFAQNTLDVATDSGGDADHIRKAEFRLAAAAASAAAGDPVEAIQRYRRAWIEGTFAVDGVNRAPIAVDDEDATDADTVLVLPAPGVLTNDVDQDGDALFVTRNDSPSAQGADVTVNPDGSVTYDPTVSPSLSTLPAGDTATDTFTYDVSDGVATDTATVTVTVTGVQPSNNPPVANDDTAATNEDTPVVITLTGSDPDGDHVTFAVTTPPSHGSLGPVNSTGPTSAEVTYTPDPDINGADSFGFKANDGTADSAEATLDITIFPINDPPAATPGGPYSAATHVAVNVVEADGLLANASDHASEPGTNLTVEGPAMRTTTAGGSVDIDLDTGAFRYEPPADFTGDDTFDYVVCDDGEGLPASQCSAPETVTITVSGPLVWFIDNSAGGPGDGTLAHPFPSIGDFNSNATQAPGDSIFLASTGTVYVGHLNLQDNQSVYGQGIDIADEAGLSPPAGSDPLPAASTNPDMRAASGVTINLASDNTIRGIDIANTPGTGVFGLTVGDFTFTDGAVRNTGSSAIFVANGTLDIELTEASGAPANVTPVVNVTQAHAGSDVDIGVVAGQNPSSAVNLNDVAGTFTFGSITYTGQGTNATGITVSGSSGLVSITGDLTVSGQFRNGIDLSNNSEDFVVGGTTTITQPGAEGIDIDGPYTGDVRLATTSITVDDPAAAGIDINSMAGTFTIDSVGGGVQFDPTGADDHHNIRLHDAADVNINGGVGCHVGDTTDCFQLSHAGTGSGLSGVGPGDSGFHALASTSSGDLTLRDVHVQNTGGDNSGGADSGVFIVDPDDDSTVSIDDSVFDDVDEDAIEVEKANGGEFILNVRDNHFSGDLSNGQGESAVHLDDWTAGWITALIQNNVVVDADTFGFLLRPAGTSGTGGTPNDITIAGNNVSEVDDNAIAVDVGGASTTELRIVDNTLVGDVDRDGSVADDEGIDICLCGDGTTGTLNVLIEDNTITDWDDDGIRVESFGSDIAGTINARIEDNTIDRLDTSNPLTTPDVGVLIAVDDDATINAVLRDNIMGAETTGFEWAPRPSNASTTRIYLENNEAPQFRFADQDDTTYELGCATFQTECANRVGGTVNAATETMTLQSILADDGNTTGSGAPFTTTSGFGPILDIVDRFSIIPLVP